MGKSKMLLIYIVLFIIFFIGCKDSEIMQKGNNGKIDDSLQPVSENTLKPNDLSKDDDLSEKGNGYSVDEILKDFTILNKIDNKIFFKDKNNILYAYDISLDEKINLSQLSAVETVFDENNVYFIVQNENYKNEIKIELYKTNFEGTNKELLISGDSLRLIGAKDEWIYFIEGSGIVSNEGKIYKINNEGNDKTDLGFSASRGKIVNGYMFYNKGKPLNTLHAYDIINGSHTRLSDGGGEIIDIADGWVYYIDKLWKLGLFKVKLDGSGETRVVDGFINDFKIIDNNIYYLSNNNIYKCNFDGSNNQKISTNMPLSSDEDYRITIINNCIYYKYINEKSEVDIGLVELEKSNIANIQNVE